MSRELEDLKQVGRPVTIPGHIEAPAPIGKRCLECGGLLDLRGRALCSSACRLKRKTRLQAWRRRRGSR